MSMLDTVLVWVEKNKGRWLGDLKGWLGIPSVSAQPELRGDVRAAAEWAKDYLRGIGMEVEMVETEGGGGIRVWWRRRRWGCVRRVRRMC